ncbi:MAG: hypothetical protein K2F83_06915 [Oscillospiraceae bacterium]|nr:hypothetical protein [Oscillospiraceae bacterium]
MEKGRRVPLFVLLCLCFCLAVSLTACGQPKLKESQVKADLEQSVRFDGQNLELEDIRIERRQNNEKSEIVYCAAIYGNEQYGVTVYYLQNYSYYDQGGWFLDGTNEYQEQEAVARSGVSGKQMSDYVKSEFGPNAQYEIISQETDLSRGNNWREREKDQVTYRVWQNGSVLSYESTGTYFWKMSDSGWRTNQNSYTTTYSMEDIIGDWYGSTEYNFDFTEERYLTIHSIQWDGSDGDITFSYSERHLKNGEFVREKIFADNVTVSLSSNFYLYWIAPDEVSFSLEFEYQDNFYRENLEFMIFPDHVYYKDFEGSSYRHWEFSRELSEKE